MNDAAPFKITQVPEPNLAMIQRYGREGTYVSKSEADSPWIPFGPTAFIRHLTFDVRTNSYCNILWVKSGGWLGTHKHHGAVSAMVLEGSVQYLEYVWVATPGDFITETPGTAHTLVSKHPEGMKAIFWLQGALEFYDQDGKWTETLDVFWFIRHYVEYCEANGLPVNEALFI
jgi:2,4'-dihydroxyacetophenone dioxygenase